MQEANKERQKVREEQRILKMKMASDLEKQYGTNKKKKKKNAEEEDN